MFICHGIWHGVFQNHHQTSGAYAIVYFYVTFRVQTMLFGKSRFALALKVSSLKFPLCTFSFTVHFVLKSP